MRKHLIYPPLALIASLGMPLSSLAEQASAPAEPSAPVAEQTDQQAAAAQADKPTGASRSQSADIVFQFEGIGYNEVIRRFAQMVDKPLIGEAPIDGTITFFDREAYSYDDALDTLNTILSMKGYTLLESGRFLRLVKLDELQQLPLPILRGLDDSQEVRPSEVVSIVLPLTHLDASEVAQAVRPMLTTAGSIATVTRGRGLIITDRVSTLRRVQNLIEQMDEHAPAERQMKTMTLANASGAVVADLINKTFGAATAPKRTVWNEQRKRFDEVSPSPEDYVTAVWEEPSRTMVLFGPAERLELATNLIERFESEGRSTDEVKIYHPRSISANELAQLIRETVPGISPARRPARPTEARLIVDNRTNRLIVAAPSATQFETIENLIRQLDSDGGQGDSLSETVLITQVFALNRDNAQHVTQIIHNATSRQGPRGEAIQQLRISHDPASSNLVVTGSPSLVQVAADIVARLDTQARPQPRQMQIFRLTTIKPDAILNNVRQLAEERLRSQRPAGQPAPHLLADTANDRLIVTATQAELEIISQIIAELDKKEQRPQRELRIIQLENQQADQVLPLVQRLFREQTRDRSSDVPAPEFIADGRRLIVLATDQDAQQISSLIEQLKSETSSETQQLDRQLRVIDLPAGRAGELHAMIQQLYREQTRNTPEPSTGPASLIADTRSNRLLVTGTPAQIEHIEKIVAELTGPSQQPADADETRIYRLQHAGANELSGLVRSALEDSRGQVPVRLQVDRHSNSLVITGPGSEVERAGQIIRQLDTAPQQGTQEMRVVTLRNSQANQVASLLRQLLTQQMRDQNGQRYQVQATISVDAQRNRLVIQAPEEEWELISPILSQLDEAEEQADNSRVFHLKHAQARALVSVIERAMQRRDRWNRLVTPVSVAAEIESNSLVVTGPREELLAVDQMIEALDRPADREARLMRQVDVPTARAQELASTTERLWNQRHPSQQPHDRVHISVAPSGDRLILIGPESRMEALEQLVSELNVATTAARQLHSLDVPAGQAGGAAALLTGLIRQELGPQAAQRVSINAHPNGRRLLVLASDQHLQRVRELLAQLQAEDQVDPRQRRIFELTDRAEAQRLYPMVQQLYRETVRHWPDADGSEAQIMLDQQNARLIVTAPEKHLTEIDRIVGELRVEPVDQARLTRVYDLKNAQARRLSQTVNQLYREQVREKPELASVNMLILPDEDANRLIVSGPEQGVTLVHELIGRLDEAASQQADALVFRLKHADPQQVATVLSNAIATRTSWGRAITRISVGVDRTSRTVVVSGERDDLRTVEQIVAQLDTADDVEPRQMRTFQLTVDNLAATATQIQRLYTEQIKGQPDAGPADAAIMPDARSGRLLVVGTEKHLTIIENLVGTLNETPAERSTRIFELASEQEVRELAALVEQTYREQWRGRGPQAGPADARFNPQPSQRRLIVTARADHLEAIDQLLTQLRAEQIEQPRLTRVYDLENAQARRLSQTVNQLYREQVREKPELASVNMLILPDEDANRLIVSGPEQGVTLVHELIGRLDEAASQQADALVFRLKHADPQQVATVLGNAIATRTSWGRAITRVSVGVDRTSRTVVVSGERDDLRAVERIVEQLDQPEDVEPRQMRVFQLSPDRLGDLSNQVSRLYAEQVKGQPDVGPANALILPDARTGRLLVMATEPHLAMIESIVTTLGDDSAAVARHMRIIQLEQASASSVASVVSQMFPQQRGADPAMRLAVSVAGDDRTLVVEAPGSTLQRVEELIAALDQQGQASPIEVRSYHLPQASVDELVTTLGSLFAQQFGRRDQPAPRFAADRSSHHLFVAALPSQLTQIHTLIQQVQTTAQIATQTQTFRLQRADASEVTALLETMLRERSSTPPQPRRRWMAPQQNEDAGPRVAPASSLNAVIVQGTPEQLALAAEMISSLDTAEPHARTVIRTVRLKQAQAGSLADAVARVIRENRNASQLGQVSVTAENNSNSLLLHGPAGEVDQVVEIIRDLDTESEQRGIDVRIYRLENGQVGELSATLQRMLSELIRQRPGRAADRPPLTVQADVRTNSLIVSTIPAYFALVEQLLGELDRVPERTEREVEFVMLQHADAFAVASQVRQMFADRPQAQRPIVEWDSHSNALTLIASRDDLQSIRPIVQQLDQGALDTVRQVRVIPTSPVPADQMAQMLMEVYAPAVAGDMEVVDRIDGPRLQLPARLRGQESQAPSPAQTDNAPQALDVAQAQADQQDDAETELPQATPGPAVAVVVDAFTNSLIVTAPRRELQEINRMVRDLSYSFFVGEDEFRTYRLEQADPVAVAQTLDQLFNPQVMERSGRGRQNAQRTEQQRSDDDNDLITLPPPNVSVVAEPRTRSVIVRAKPRDFMLIESLVGQLDQVATVVSEIRVFSLEHVDAQQVAGNLLELFRVVAAGQPAPRGQQQQAAIVRRVLTLHREDSETPIRVDASTIPTITANRDTNALVVAGIPDAIHAIEQILGQLEQSVADVSAPAVRMYPLDSVDVAGTVRTLREIFAADTRRTDRRSPRVPVVIAGNDTGRMLVVSASPQDHDLIQSVLGELDNAQAERGALVRVYRLGMADARSVAQALTAMFEPAQRGQPQAVRISADASSNAVVVRGDETSHQRIAELIHDMDGTRLATNPLRTIALQRANPDRLAETLRRAFTEQQQRSGRRGRGDTPRAQVVIESDRDSRTLLVRADDEAFEQIESLARQLDRPLPDAGVVRTILTLKHASADRIAPALQSAFVPARDRQDDPEHRVTIAADRGSNSLIVTASEANLKKLQHLLEQLDTEAVASGLDFRLFPLEHVEPAKIMPIVRQVMRQVQIARAGDPVTVLADDRTRALIVTAPPALFDQIGQIIQRLDTPPAFPQAEMTMITLRQAEAARLAQVLERMLEPTATGQATPEARSLQEQVRLLRVRDEQGQYVELDLSQPIKIMADPLQAGQRGGNRLIISSTPENLLALDAVVRMMDTVPVSTDLKVQFVRVQHADAQVIAQTLRDMFTQGQRLIRGPVDDAEPDNLSGKAMAHPIHVAVDARTNSLVLSGREESIALAHLVITDMDREHERFVTDIRLFQLKHASAARIAPLLRSVFAETVPSDGAAGVRRHVSRLRTMLLDSSGAGQVTELASQRAALTIQPDAGANVLVVAARRDMMPLIEDVIQTMDVQGAKLKDVRIYPLEHAEAQRMRDVVMTLYTGPQAESLAPARRPTVTIDTRTNALVVSGDEAAFETIESLIKQLDGEVSVALRDVQVIRLQYADAAPVASVVQRMMDARVERQASADQVAADRMRVIVVGEARTNSLLVGGSRESFELVESLVAQLDQEGPALSGQVRLMPLQHATAPTLAATLTNLFNQRYQAAQTVDVQRRRPIIVPDMRTNSLLISADVEDTSALEALVAQLDSESAVRSADVRLYRLEHASAVQLAPALQQFFTAKRSAEQTIQTGLPIMPVQVRADARSNTLMIAGPRDDFEQIENMIASMDTSETRQAAQYQMFTLQKGTATQLQATLQQLFANRPTQPGRPNQPISIVADNWSNTLIVGAATEDMPMVESLVAQLDQSPSESGVAVHVLPVTKGDARQIADTVEGLYRSDRPGAVPVTVRVDERLNALVVSAAERDVERMRELVRQLDTAAVSRVAELRVFRLKHAEAPALAGLLTASLTSAPDSARPQNPQQQTLLQFVTRSQDGRDLVASALQEGVLITADRRTNSLLVSAPVDNMAFLEQLIGALDSASPQMAQIRIFSLTNADARQMADIMTSLFRLRAAPSTTGDTDRSVNYTLVLPASGTSSDAASDVETASATMGTAERHALTVTVDVRTNSLLLGGTEHYVQLASRLIEELDSAPAQERKTQAYRLRNAQTENVESALRRFLDQERQRLVATLGNDALGAAQRLLEREVAIVGDPNTNTLLISASPRYFDTVMGLLEELDQAPPQVLIQVLLAEVMLDQSNELGVEWSAQAVIDSVTTAIGTNFGVAQQLAQSGGFSVAVTGGDVDFLLRALQEDGRLEVLSRPQILAADNRPAEINIGQAIPLITASRVTDRGDTINQITYRDVGVILSVIPRISPDGFVRLDVTPEISAMALSDVEIQPGVRAPVINQRTATTTVTVQDGQTIMIGGMISSRDNQRDRKIPFLGDIPGVGALFRSTVSERERSELLIIMTPHILNNVAHASELTGMEMQRSDVFNLMKHNRPMDDKRIDPMFSPLKPFMLPAELADEADLEPDDGDNLEQPERAAVKVQP